MPMTRNDLLNAIIDDGIHEISSNYLEPRKKAKREGAIAGFEICRGKTNEQLISLHTRCKMGQYYYVSPEDISESTPWMYYPKLSSDRHWCFRYFELQVEWVLNVLSAALHNTGQEPLTGYTLRGAMKAADILGVKEVA